MADVTVSITVPSADVERVVTALCNAGGLPVSEPNAKLAIINSIKATVRSYEESVAQAAAALAAAVPSEPGVS